MKSEKSLTFYSQPEIKALRVIKSLPTLKERRASLEEFCKKFDRTPHAARCKMNKLKKMRAIAAKAARGSTTTISKNQVVLPYKSFEVKGNANGGVIIFSW